MSRGDLVVDDKTKLDQRRASDPRASAWVSANAGAGKTKVLSDRVLRLLLSGAPPARILCLTFTKAAAANMSIRVFERLGRWVALDDAALADELRELEGEAPSAAQLRMARRLFARAVETPGGLKIETIHAFCERLLHLVPFEANVPARFVVLDEAQIDELVAEATRNVLAEAAAEEPAGAPAEKPAGLADAFTRISLDAAGERLSAVLKAAVQAVKCGKLPGGLESSIARLRETLGLAPGDGSAAIEHAILEEGIARPELRAIADELAGSGSSADRARADTILAYLAADRPAERLRHYRCIFFTEDGRGGPRSKMGTKAVAETAKDALAAEQARIIPLCEKLKAALAAERTEALFTLAGAIVRRVEAHKQRLGALDFDDLIAKTLALLSRGDGAWVLYKLDRGIDHVLIDEAQDTNPEQWRILRHITEDFSAGSGAREGRIRTVFAVGDPKQSIYSFQGAAPREFEESRRDWRQRMLEAEMRFEDVRLTLSFRSAKGVLSAVDETFRLPAHFKGLSFEDAAVGTMHESARPQASGRVELWPVEVPHKDDEEPEAWVLPLDEPERHAPPVVVAARVAKAIKAWTTRGDEGERIWSPGDIIVLVRKRNAAFEAVIRALKSAGVPVAGADRIDIGAHIAVLDLVAAGRAALLPDDDLTLATALKSPLIGFDDDDLIRIAVGRDESQSLHAALHRHAETGDARARAACAALQEWRDLAQKHGPFGFYASLLGPLGGRRRLVARLGTEAGDAIDAFLSFAHNAGAIETPSLTTFLARFESAGHEVKRDLESGRGEVRVMTVHGAKGLEAPIVIVIDGCQVLGPDPALIPVPVGNAAMPVWSPGRKYDPPPVAAARKELQERGKEEHNRLLYVAMTRAKDRLVIAPYRSGEKPVEEAWCEMVRRGLTQQAGGLVLSEAPHGPVEIWHDANPWPAPLAVTGPAAAPVADFPAWLAVPVAPEPEPAPPLRPSSALPHRTAWRRAGGGYAQARLRGALVHALLERLPTLPPEKRATAAAAYVRARAPKLDEPDRDRIVESALSVIGHPALAPLFGPGVRAEVAIAGHLRMNGAARPVTGQIDRLAVTEAEVLVADFKSDASPPAAHEPPPRAYAAQLAVYRALLAEIYPGRPVRSLLIWTAGPLIQELADEELERALDLLTAA